VRPSGWAIFVFGEFSKQAIFNLAKWPSLIFVQSGFFGAAKDESLEQKRVGYPGVRSAEMVAVAHRNPHRFRGAIRILP
jgi:hypothetical protein